MRALKQNWGQISAEKCMIAMPLKKIRDFTNEIAAASQSIVGILEIWNQRRCGRNSLEKLTVLLFVLE